MSADQLMRLAYERALLLPYGMQSTQPVVVKVLQFGEYTFTISNVGKYFQLTADDVTVTKMQEEQPWSQKFKDVASAVEAATVYASDLGETRKLNGPQKWSEGASISTYNATPSSFLADPQNAEEVIDFLEGRRNEMSLWLRNKSSKVTEEFRMTQKRVPDSGKFSVSITNGNGTVRGGAYGASVFEALQQAAAHIPGAWLDVDWLNPASIVEIARIRRDEPGHSVLVGDKWVESQPPWTAT